MILARRSVLLAAAGAAALPTAARAQAKLTPIVMAVSSNSLAFGGMHIALQAGLFEKNGLSPKVIVSESGAAAMAAVLSGSVDFAAGATGEVLAARLHGQKIVMVTNFYRGLSGSLVLSKTIADRLGAASTLPLAAKLKALDGLVIATPSATSSYTRPYKNSAQSVGATPRLVYMTQPAMLAALQSGAIQGFIAGAPFTISAVKNGTGVVWISGPRGELPAEELPATSACFDTSEDYVAAHPEIIRAFQAVFADLIMLIRDHPQDALRHLSEAYPQLDSDSAAEIFRDESPNWSRPVLSEADAQHEIALQVASGLLKGAETVAPKDLLVHLK